MAKDVEYNVTATDKTGTALASAEAKFKATQERINRESAKTGDGLKKAADTGAGAVGRLRKELDFAEADLKKLATAFANAGSASERIDITKKMRAQRGAVRELQKAIASIGDEAPAVGASVGQAVGIGVAAAAPLIGATISAAVIGGASGAGVLGGVYLAARDPRVKAAGAELGQNLLGQLERDAAPFLDPVLENITKVEVRFGQMNTRIKNIFANSSGYLDPLVDGALDAVDGILRGVDALVAKGAPVIGAFGRLFSTIGNSAGDAFEIISGGSDEAAQAIDDVGVVLQVLVETTAVSIRFLTELYGVLTFFPRKAREIERSWLGWDDQQKAVASTTAILATVQKTAAIAILSAGEAAGQAGLNMQTYADKMADAANKGRGLYDSQTQVAQAVADARKALHDNGKTLSLNSEKGRENRQVLSQLAGALTANYDAYVKVNGEGAAAQKVAQRNRDQFIKLAGSFGLSKAQASNLATQMGLIKSKKIDFYANTHDAAGRLKALQGQINNVHGKTVNVSVAINTGRLASIENRLNRLGGSLYNAAGPSWAALDSSSGVARTGGPTPVSLTNSIAVSLDGKPFYAIAVQAAQDRSDRDAYRQKVGRR